MKEPILTKGGIAVDDRGALRFINDLDMSTIKRFYIVSNHKQGFVRAWHAHKKEAKYAIVIKGAAKFGVVEIDVFEHPSPTLIPKTYVLSEVAPSALYIPDGYANGFVTLTDDTIVMFFSTTTLEESKGDDYRFPARLWDCWNVEER